MRRAFTLIELIFTMVILGIVAYVATSLIAKTYVSYNRVNTLHKANLKVELALNNIANRLSYAIVDTIVKRKSATENGISPISFAPDDYQVLEWVGYDVDGFEANKNYNNPIKSAWSGFCDIQNSTKSQIKSPGSNLDFASDIIYNLSKGAVDNLDGTALFFPGNYNYNNIGYSNTTGGVDGVNIVDSATNDTFTLKSDAKRITEHYKLAWSAYAVVPAKKPISKTDNPCKEIKNTTANDCSDEKPCNLCLKYNFRPWLNEEYNSNDTPYSVLATNVTVFKTFAVENRVHIKLCVQEQIGAGVNNTTSICKEKVVFR
jgi:prepilin-type N-terminal cleavage/methylation domain-containing protein